jgi:endo-1,4-beta-xylanase
MVIEQRTLLCLLPFLMIALAACPQVMAQEQTVIRLWSDGAPGSEARAAEPENVQPAKQPGASLHVSNIHNPSVTVCQPAKDKATGAAIIIAPGGGHQYLSYDIEGTEVARWLNEQGIAAFILKYRLAREPGSTYQVEDHALADAQRAIRLVRSRAGEWNVDPNRIGVMGFSAGGQLAALAATRFDSGKSESADPVERMSSRPDFQIRCYGANRAATTLPANIPPAFFVGAADDRIAASLPATFTSYVNAGVKSEIHIYSHGGHGFGMRDRSGQGGPVVQWNQRLKEWLIDQKLLGPTKEE